MSEKYLDPLADQVIIEVTERITRRDSGIIIPEWAAEKPRDGIVIAVGPGRRERLTGELVAMSVRPGDHVIFGEYGGHPVRLGDREFVTMREDSIFAVIRTREVSGND